MDEFGNRIIERILWSNSHGSSKRYDFIDLHGIMIYENMGTKEEAIRILNDYKRIFK